MTTLQIRIEDDMKIQATAICSELGIDLSTLVRMCLKKTIQEGGIPFEMKVSDTTRKGISAINSMRQKSYQTILLLRPFVSYCLLPRYPFLLYLKLSFQMEFHLLESSFLSTFLLM